MYQNILVALDGSSSSKRALKEAVGLAALMKGVVHPLYVVDKTPLFSYAGYYDPITFIDAVRKTGRSALAEAERACAGAGVKCRAELVETNNLSDDVASAVLRHANQAHAELLVMGTHGRRGVRRLVIGSVAEQVMRFARCPVLLIREEDKHESVAG
ncbi:universal stress protein [Paraburkholderia sp. CNPSo 3155]|uniref:Nucleotide-binding universal stress UspA family protein n=1 Tax=Paraburkholderia atlantica TaxID=2654982 RepID=A0A6I1Q9Z3_PARAM|nr:universal stress protein [Paraburkholderia atlantica]MBB5428954.1 nucleotide-binding universal stress UspA family protein [Paraburkholderia atlantica]MPW08430.1 universal stress protein [Paraburkholderia atlantica]